MTKATSWFWNSTLPSASTICTSPASVGIQARLTVFNVSAVMTASTPGTFSASVSSIFLTRACACSPYLRAWLHVFPAWESCRSFRSLLEFNAIDLGGGVLDRLDDVLVAGAAADIARNAHPDVFLSRRRILLEQALRAQNHAGRAEAALQAVHHPKTFLQRRQRTVGIGDAFDGGDVGTLCLHGKHGA